MFPGIFWNIFMVDSFTVSRDEAENVFSLKLNKSEEMHLRLHQEFLRVQQVSFQGFIYS